MFLFEEKHHSGEEEYNIEIPDEDVDQMIKIKDLVEYINNKLSKQLDEAPWKN